MISRRAPAWSVAIVLALVVGTVATATSARAQRPCDGVGVVVDATALGGDVTTRCAPGDPSTGLEALTGAGHSYTFVPRQPGLVCTIDARPDPCNGAPADAYWSYWHAEAGGSWTYSTRGAGNRDPEPGTVEGWAFGAGEPPREPPPGTSDDPQPEPEQDPAPDPPPPAPSSDGTAAGTGDDDAAAPGESDPTTAAARTSPDPDSDGTIASASSPAPVPSPDASPSQLDDPPGPVEPATASPTPAPLADEVTTPAGGAPVGLLAAGLLIAGLAGAGVLRTRRRDRA